MAHETEEISLVADASPTDMQVAERTYLEVCSILQLPAEKRPKLDLMTEAQAKEMTLHGDYSPGSHTIRLSPATVGGHYTIAHELVHAVCRKELRYLGSHGVLFIVLHDLVVHFFFNNGHPSNQWVRDYRVIKAEWSCLAKSSTKTQAQKEAAEIVSSIIGAITVDPSKAPLPSILDLGSMVAASAAGKYCFSWTGNPRAAFSFFDRTWTQKGAIFWMIGWFFRMLAIGATGICIIAFGLLVHYDQKWLAWVLGISAGVAAGSAFLGITYNNNSSRIAKAIADKKFKILRWKCKWFPRK